eukprot:227876-Amphidinium_carterae.1
MRASYTEGRPHLTLALRRHTQSLHEQVNGLNRGLASKTQEMEEVGAKFWVCAGGLSCLQAQMQEVSSPEYVKQSPRYQEVQAHCQYLQTETERYKVEGQRVWNGWQSEEALAQHLRQQNRLL